MRTTIFLLLAAILAVACPVQAQSTLTIGLVDAQGRVEKGNGFEGHVYWGAMLAIQDVLAGGQWDPSVKIELLHRETGSFDKDGQIRIAEELINAGVAGVILGVQDYETKNLLARLGPAGVPTMLIGAQDPWFTSQGWLNVWRVSDNYLLEFRDMASFLVGIRGMASVYAACAGAQDGAACEDAQLLAAWMQEFGAAVVGMGNISGDGRAQVLADLAATGPDVVYVSGEPTDIKIFFDDLRYSKGMDVPMAMSSYSCNKNFFTYSTTSRAGVFCSNPMAQTSPAHAAFDADYKQRTGHASHPEAAMAYDATLTLLSAMYNAGTTEPSAVRAAMLGLDYPGVTKHIAFDEYGDTNPSYKIVVTYDTGFRLVYDPGTNTLYE